MKHEKYCFQEFKSKSKKIGPLSTNWNYMSNMWTPYGMGQIVDKFVTTLIQVWDKIETTLVPDGDYLVTWLQYMAIL